LEAQRALLARPALGRLGGGAVGARLEVQVAEPAVAALGDADPFAVTGEVEEQLAGRVVVDLRAHGHAQHDVLSALAVLVRPTPVLSLSGGETAGVAKIDQRVEVAVGDRVDRAAAAAVAAVRPAERNELLAAKRGRAVAAVPGRYLDACLVDELHCVAL